MTRENILLKYMNNYIYLLFNIQHQCVYKMNKMLAFRGLLGLAFAVVISQSVIANNDFTVEEANTILKEDIAAAQVMSEVCPAIMGKNAKFDGNITTLTQSYLADYSDKSMTLEKLRQARKMIDASGRDIRLEVDGGVTPANIREIAEAGADMFVAGSAIFGKSDYQAVIAEMRRELALAGTQKA